MKLIVLTSFLLSTLAHASGTSRVVETETQQVTLENPLQLPLTCAPGRRHGFPTPSFLAIHGLAPLFGGKTQLDFLGFDDDGSFGDRCAALTKEFAATLPAVLTVIRTITETCIQDDSGRDNRAHYTTWQSLSGGTPAYRMGGASEIIAEHYEPNARCR